MPDSPGSTSPAATRDWRSVFPKAHFDRAEAFASLPPSAPGLLLGAICGTLLCFAARRPELRVCRAPLAGAFAGGLLLFTWGFISYRYLEDTLPWLAVGSVIALTQIPRLKSDRLRHAVTGLVLLLTAYGVWTNFAFAIVQQRFYAYPIPQEKRLVFERLYRRRQLGRPGRDSGVRGRSGASTWKLPPSSEATWASTAPPAATTSR